MAGPYHIHKTMESAVNEARTTSNCYVVVDRAVVVRHGMNFLTAPWRFHGEDQKTNAVFFEHPERVKAGTALLDEL